MGRSGRRQPDIEAVSYKGLRCNKALDHGYVDQTERRSQSLDFKASLWIQLDRRPLVGGSNRGGIKAPSEPFPSFSKSGVFGSKLFQIKLWRFCGISRGYKASKRPLMVSKFFSSDRPFLTAFWTPPDRIPLPRLDRVRRSAGFYDALQ